MIPISADELITKYLSYYSRHKSDIDAREKNNDAMLKEFFDRFDVQTMSLDDYCFEKGNSNSYCYWI